MGKNIACASIKYPVSSTIKSLFKIKTMTLHKMVFNFYQL